MSKETYKTKKRLTKETNNRDLQNPAFRRDLPNMNYATHHSENAAPSGKCVRRDLHTEKVTYK